MHGGRKSLPVSVTLRDDIGDVLYQAAPLAGGLRNITSNQSLAMENMDSIATQVAVDTEAADGAIAHQPVLSSALEVSGEASRSHGEAAQQPLQPKRDDGDSGSAANDDDPPVLLSQAPVCSAYPANNGEMEYAHESSRVEHKLPHTLFNVVAQEALDYLASEVYQDYAIFVAEGSRQQTMVASPSFSADSMADGPPSAHESGTHKPSQRRLSASNVIGGAMNAIRRASFLAPTGESASDHSFILNKACRVLTDSRYLQVRYPLLKGIGRDIFDLTFRTPYTYICLMPLNVQQAFRSFLEESGHQTILVAHNEALEIDDRVRHLRRVHQRYVRDNGVENAKSLKHHHTDRSRTLALHVVHMIHRYYAR